MPREKTREGRGYDLPGDIEEGENPFLPQPDAMATNDWTFPEGNVISRPMAVSHTFRLLALCALGLLASQALICHAESAGLVPCPDSHQQEQSTCQDESSRPQSGDDGGTTGCHYCACHNPAVTHASPMTLCIPPQDARTLSGAPPVCPEAPVFSIEHPPQLS